MLYVIDQRLRAQSISLEKSAQGMWRVLNLPENFHNDFPLFDFHSFA